MRAVLLQPPTKLWECPSCRARHKTNEARPHVPMHTCPALHGAIAPYVDVTDKELNPSQQRHVVVERQDYVGHELVQVDDRRRPIQAVLTERADGSNDCHVMAPTATNSRE